MAINNPRKFLRHPRPEFDESISGYLIRLAESNGYYFRDIWTLFGLGAENLKTKRPLAYIYGCADYSVLSQRTKLSSERLKRLAYLPIKINPEQYSGIYDLFDNKVESYLLRYKTSALCSGCLAEKPYQKKVWDFLSVTACPIHKQMLLDSCPNCKEAISYRRDRICFCGCGYDFRTDKNRSVPDKELRLITRIYQLCGLLSVTKNEPQNISQALLHLNLSGLLHTIFLVSGQIAADGGIKGKFLSKISIEERHQILNSSVNVYEDFPKKFFEFLDLLKNEFSPTKEILRHTNSHKGRANIYDRVIQLIGKSMNEPQFDFLRNALDEFIGRGKLASDKVGIDYTKSSAEQFFSNHTTLREAARYLKSSKKVIVEMIKNGALQAYEITKPGSHPKYYVNLQSLEQVSKRLAGVISVVDAARSINIHFHQMNSLVNAGVIKLVEDVKLAPQYTRIVERKAVLELYNLFYKAMLKNPAYEVSGKQLSSRGTAVALGFLQIDFGKMTQLILNGELAPAGHNEKKGLNAFTYDECQIKTIVESEIKRRTKNTLLFTELPKILRVKKDIVQALVRKNYFPVIDMKTVLGKRVPQDVFKKFQSDFILSNEIALKFSTSAEYANQKLAAKNIFPVDNTLDQYNHLYRRSDLKGIIIKKSNPADWTYSKRRNTLLSPQDAAKRLGMSEDNLMLAVERKLIYFSRNKYRKGVFSEAGIDSFQKLKLPHLNFLREKEAANLLDMSVKAFRKRYLNTKRIIPEVRHYRNNSHCRFYSIEDINTLKAQRNSETCASKANSN